MDKYYEICSHPLFKNLLEKDLKNLVPLFKEYSCDEGAVIYYQKDGADSLYLFVEGEFCSSTPLGEDKKFYFKGDYTNPQEVIENSNYSDTLVCRSSGKYLGIKRSDFLQFMKNLRGSKNNKANYSKDNFLISGFGFELDGCQKNKPHKISSYHWRRSSFFLFEKLFYPFAFFIALLLISKSSFSFPFENYVYKSISIIIITYILFRLIFWLSEKFSLTEKNISAIKIKLKPLGIKRNLLPLDQIRGIKIEKKKLKNRFFNIGSILIQTSSGTVLKLSDIDDPSKVQKIISDFILETNKNTSDRERIEIRKKMETYFDSKENIRSYDKEKEIVKDKVETIVFNKSFYYLIIITWWQILILGALAVFTYLFRDNQGGLFVIPGLPFLFLFLWRFQDWRNDLYKVANGKIIDINKKPFGKSESNNLADIGFVTNIRSERKGFLQYLFNYGDVLIETAGGNIKFESVSSPLSVQSKLLEMRESWKMKEEEKKRSQQFQDFLVYSEIYKQEEEQERIGRLTPPVAKKLSYGVKKRC